MSPDNPTSQFAELPHRVLSGGLSLSKAEVEGPVRGSCGGSCGKLPHLVPLSGKDETSRAEPKGTSRAEPKSLSPVYPASLRDSCGSTSRAELHPVRSCGAKEESPLQEEIDSMRCNLKHLVETFSTVETLDEHFKLSSAINYTTASLTRLVRAQQILRDHQPNTFDQTVERAINEVLKEWNWI